MYRVETFIVPATNRCNTEISVNEIDDVKLANKLTTQTTTESLENNEGTEAEQKTVSSLISNNSFNNLCSDQCSDLCSKECNILSSQDTDEQKEKSMNHSESMSNETKLDKSIDSLTDCCYHGYKSGCMVSAPTPEKISEEVFKQNLSESTSSEMKLDKSIDRLTDCCYHGYKNGCTVSAPTPEKISEEVFKQNWLRKLETLRQREAMLNDKEIALQCRERLLLRKEKELQILEKLVQNKVKQARIYLKRCSDLQKFESNNDTEEEKTSESRSSNSSRNSSKKYNHANTRDDSEKSYHSKESIKKSNSREKGLEDVQCHVQEVSDTIVLEQELQNPQNSEVSATSSTLQLCKGIPKSRSTKQFSYNSAKFRTRPKISYDDLDSTLSADPGDSSFVRTSKIFNPEAYRKPFAFANLNCERSKHTNNKEITMLSTIKEMIQHPASIEEKKVIKRITENISASQDGTTKYQDYGLIDQQKSSDTLSKTVRDVIYDEKKYSYLNLETGWKDIRLKSGKVLKERPVSWNKETDDWLRKKRLAYNLSIRRAQTKNSEDKENIKFTRKESKIDKMDKPVKKKNIRSKMFNVFR